MEASTLTVLLVELPGFATLSPQSSSNEVNVLLKEVYEISDSTMRLHQGTIINFSGDNFSVVFNSSKSESATALCAIEAINEFKERLDTWFKDKKLSTDFSFKAGITLGDAIVEEFGTADKKHVMVMGEALSFATRLREFAEDGLVLVNEDVFEAGRNQYNFQKLEPLPIRGSKKSLPVFELKEKKRAKITPETFLERRIASEMVGRNVEVNALEGCINKLISGKGSVVNVIGKAGIGKSRLVEEMKAQTFMLKVRLLEGRALSMGKSLSFHPITHIIKSWAGISEEDPPAVSSEKLQASIIRGAKEQADEIFPFIATMMGLPLHGKAKERVAGIEGEALEKLILKNLRDLITASTSQMPVIIMIEDMHWADSSSISFLESLYKLALKKPVMFINVFRPGYEETGDYILKYLEETLPDDHQNINIEALVETESKELIGNLLQKASLPAGLNEIIIRKTEGNPFFIEEVIRSFIDDGIIEIKGKEFRITEKIAEVNIPETINEVILSRVDKLDEKTKDLLKTASVIGRNFYYKVLEEAANTIGELDDRLQYLKEVQLIGESKKKEEIEYLFKHALAQQATYESIIQNSKKELHLKIARSIEKVFAENIHEFYGTLAYHYELAENREKTLDFLVKAGNEAMNSGGSADGINFYNKALKLYLLLNKKTDDVDLLKSIYLSLGKAYHSRGMANEAVEVLDKALLLFGFKFPKSKIRLMAGFIYNLIYYVFAVYNDKYFFNKSNDTDRDQLFEVIFHRGRTVSSISSKRFIVEGFYSTKPLFSTDLSKNSNAFAVFVGFSAGFFWTGISLKTSSRIFKVSERFVNEKNTHAYQVFRYSQKMNNYHCGILKTDGDLDFLFDFCMKKGFFFEAAYILFYNGFCYGDKGNRQKCQEITANLLLVADQFESKQMMSMYYRFIAFTSLRYREFNISIIEKIKEGIELMRKTEHNVLLADLCSRLCTLYLFHGNIASAQTYLDEASMHLKTFKSAKPFYVSYLMAKTRYQLEQLKSEKTINSGQKKKLREIIKELIKTAMKFRGTLPEALLLKAEVYQYLLNYKVCFNALKAAQQFAEKSEAKVELSRVYFELGKFLSNPKTKQKQLNGLSGKDYLEKAKSLFEEMNLQWDLEEFKSFYHTSQNDTAR